MAFKGKNSFLTVNYLLHTYNKCNHKIIPGYYSWLFKKSVILLCVNELMHCWSMALSTVIKAENRLSSILLQFSTKLRKTFIAVLICLPILELISHNVNARITIKDTEIIEIMLSLNKKCVDCLDMHGKEWGDKTATSVVLCFPAFICLRFETLWHTATTSSYRGSE